MKKLFTALVAVASLSLAACSEQSIDRTLEHDGVQGSMVEGRGRGDSNRQPQEEVETGRVRVQPRWQEVKKMRGRSDQSSKPFSVDSDQWTISWKTQPSESDGEFMIFLYDKENPNAEPLIIATSPENAMAEMEGSGVFYLKVHASQPYEIEVKEFK